MKKGLITLLAAAALVTGCSQSIKSASEDFNSFFPAVQKTVRAQAPNAEIVNVSEKTENGAKAYEVELREEGGSPQVSSSARWHAGQQRLAQISGRGAALARAHRGDRHAL